MKKSCEGCRALDLNSYSGLYLYSCGLDYIIDKNKGIPFEDCPKPKTIQKMINLKVLKEKHKLTNDELNRWKIP